jgi:hypothetical protein
VHRVDRESPRTFTICTRLSTNCASAGMAVIPMRPAAPLWSAVVAAQALSRRPAPD